MIEARRSVGAPWPQAAGEESLPAALQRMTDLARRTTDMGIELTIDELPPLGGMEREIIGIAQEALTNAVRHSRGQTVSLRASAVRAIGFRLSVADDGRGIVRGAAVGRFRHDQHAGARRTHRGAVGIGNGVDVRC